MEIARHAKIAGVGEMTDGVVEKGQRVGKAAAETWEGARGKWYQGKVLRGLMDRAEGMVRERMEE